jgi:hypothetical protein
VLRNHLFLPGLQDDDSDDDDASLLNGLAELRTTRQAVVGKLREQTALKQTLMELDDQNARNRVEISKLKVRELTTPAAVPISAGKENAAGVAAAGKGASAAASSGGSSSSSGKQDVDQKALKKAQKAKREMHALKHAIGANVAKKEELEKELAAAERSMGGNEAARKLVALAAEVGANTPPPRELNLSLFSHAWATPWFSLAACSSRREPGTRLRRGGPRAGRRRSCAAPSMRSRCCKCGAWSWSRALRCTKRGAATKTCASARCSSKWTSGTKP